jgi:hypothetical protein
MKGIKTIIFIVVAIFMIRLAIILGGFIIDMAGVAAPSDKHGVDALKEGLGDAADYFHEKSGRTDAQREKSMNDAGLFYNPSTGEYEEDWDKYSKYLDSKYGKQGE